MKPWLVLCALGALGCSSKPTGGEPAKPGPAAPAAPTSAASPSRVLIEHLHSEALGVDKDVVVYLPRGYDADPAKRWPVFYYLHGLAGNETNWVQRGHLDAIADQAGVAAIIVMPDGDDGFYIDSAAPIDYDACIKTGDGMFAPMHEAHETNCVHARNYETYIARELVGWADARYRTIARRDGRGIAGLSMGGFGAMSIGLRHADAFAAAASHSGAIGQLYAGPRPFVPGQATLRTEVVASPGRIAAWVQRLFGTDLATWKAHDVVELAQQLPVGRVALYFDCGTEDDFGLFDNLQYVHEALTARHVEHEYFLGPGKHDFAFWSARLPASLAFLTAHTAKPQ